MSEEKMTTARAAKYETGIASSEKEKEILSNATPKSMKGNR